MDPSSQCYFRSGIVQPKLGTIVRSLKHHKIFLKKGLAHLPFHKKPAGKPSNLDSIVIPVKTGIHEETNSLDSRFRGNDKERG
jgi:hypothetical protein